MDPQVQRMFHLLQACCGNRRVEKYMLQEKNLAVTKSGKNSTNDQITLLNLGHINHCSCIKTMKIQIIANSVCIYKPENV